MILKEIKQEEREKYFMDNYPSKEKPNFNEKRICIHCKSVINVGDYKVEISENLPYYDKSEFIVCPNAPTCDGNILDWFEYDEKLLENLNKKK
jgi:hypothetical protein